MLQLTHETFDMLILAMPAVVVVLAVTATLLLLFRRLRGAAVTAVLLLLANSWTEQIPVHWQREMPDQKPASTIRILEYNVCGKVEYAKIHETPEFLDFFTRMDADILFLPENTGGVVPKLEAKLKSDYPYSLHSFPEFESKDFRYADYSIYSRYPLSNYRNYQVDNKKLLQEHPYLDSLAVVSLGTHFMAYEVTADIQGQAVTLLHVHMRSNSYDSARANADGRRQKAHNVYDRLLVGYAYRAAESQVVADMLRDCPNPLIICGDFNDLSGSRSLRVMQNCRRDNIHSDHRDRLRDAWWEGGLGFGFTYVDQHLWLRLDHILYSKEFDLQSIRVLDEPFSDHRPLVADFVMQ